MSNIVRFAPSPTGNFHIGGVRTALFNWLFAFRTGGKFLLRIEDTDKKRSEDKHVKDIFQSLEWLGITYDEIVYQSDNLKRHLEIVEILLSKGKAYKENFADGTSVVRMKIDKVGITQYEDIVYGNMSINNSQNDDMIILRSDGTPTYMLAVVVDDYDSGITHIIRGSDHMTNTFRQIQIYNALDWSIPMFCHIPLIHDQVGKKLSKRNNIVNLDDFRTSGFLSEAMVSYLVRLGWSCDTDEILHLKNIKKLFTLDKIGKSPAKYDFNKLNSVNAYFIKNYGVDKISKFFLSGGEFDLKINTNHGLELFNKLLPFYISRVSTLKELYNEISLIEIENDVLRSWSKNTDNALFQYLNRQIIEKFYSFINNSEEYDTSFLKKCLQSLTNSGFIKKDCFMSLRIVILGTISSPSILEICVALGRKFVLNRIYNFLEYCE